MWERVRATDWSATSLGPFAAWPVTLKATLRLALSSQQPICFWWGPDLLQFHNEAFLPVLTGREGDAFGQPFRRFWADVWDGVEPFVRQALGGRGTFAEDLPLQMLRDGRPTPTWWTFSYSPLYGDDGGIAGLMNIVTETTGAVLARRAQSDRNEKLAGALSAAEKAIVGQREAEKVRRVLQRELAHRLKNSFAMVQAIVTQSARAASSAEEAGRAIGARVRALSAAQDLLIAAREEGAEVAEIVAATLAPHVARPDRVEVAGPPVYLSAQPAMGLALAVHELATNAAKYGSLAASDGRVEVAWSASGGAFRFGWRERGGPPVAPPTRRGFGSRLLDRIVPGYFGGRAASHYPADGYRYELDGFVET